MRSRKISRWRLWRIRALAGLYLCLIGSSSGVFAAEPLSPILSVESPYSLEATVSNLKEAIQASNFRFIRELPWNGELMKVSRAEGRAQVLYFCNFAMVNQIIAVDRRFSQFLPCRVVVSERHGRVLIQAVDPLYISRLLGNERLGVTCRRARDMYLRLMDEATL